MEIPREYLERVLRFGEEPGEDWVVDRVQEFDWGWRVVLVDRADPEGDVLPYLIDKETGVFEVQGTRGKPLALAALMRKKESHLRRRR